MNAETASLYLRNLGDDLRAGKIDDAQAVFTQQDLEKISELIDNLAEELEDMENTRATAENFEEDARREEDRADEAERKVEELEQECEKADEIIRGLEEKLKNAQ